MLCPLEFGIQTGAGHKYCQSVGYVFFVQTVQLREKPDLQGPKSYLGGCGAVQILAGKMTKVVVVAPVRARYSNWGRV